MNVMTDSAAMDTFEADDDTPEAAFAASIKMPFVALLKEGLLVSSTLTSFWNGSGVTVEAEVAAAASTASNMMVVTSNRCSKRGEDMATLTFSSSYGCVLGLQLLHTKL